MAGRSIWFIIGNLSKQSALEIADKGRSLLIGGKEREKFLKSDLCSVRPINLKGGEWYRIEQALDDKDNENNCQVTYFEAGAFSKTNLNTKMIH